MISSPGWSGGVRAADDTHHELVDTVAPPGLVGIMVLGSER